MRRAVGPLQRHALGMAYAQLAAQCVAADTGTEQDEEPVKKPQQDHMSELLPQKR